VVACGIINVLKTRVAHKVVRIGVTINKDVGKLLRTITKMEFGQVNYEEKA
jgi:hypothetical protein